MSEHTLDITNIDTSPCHLTLIEQCSQLSFLNRLLCVSTIVVYVVLLAVSNTSIVLIPLCMIPTVLLLYVCSQHNSYDHCIKLDIIIQLYSIGYTVYLTTIMLYITISVCIALLVGYLITNQYLIIHPSISYESIIYYLQIIGTISIYLVLNCIELLFSYKSIHRILTNHSTTPSNITVIHYSAAYVSGYTTCYLMINTVLSSVSVQPNHTYHTLINTILSLILDIPIHISSSILVVIGLIRRDIQHEQLTSYQIILLPLLLQSTLYINVWYTTVVLYDTTIQLVVYCIMGTIIELIMILIVRYYWDKYQINNGNNHQNNVTHSCTDFTTPLLHNHNEIN